MAKPKHSPEWVINKLRRAQADISEGNTQADASRTIGVTD